MTSNALLDESAPARKKPEPVVLRSAHDYGLVTQALELRKEDLKSLATKTVKEGYSREAAVMSADANAIEHHVLPAFRAQRELPLVTHEQLEKNIAAALRPSVWKAFDGMGDPKVLISFDTVARRRESLHEHLVKRLALYVKDVAAEAYRQGMAAREQTPESMADRSIATLRAQGD